MNSKRTNTDQKTFSVSKLNTVFLKQVTRRNWLKFFSLSIGGLIISIVGKYIWKNSQSPITKIDLPEEFILNSKAAPNHSKTIKLTTYKFDVITVNDRGQEIERKIGQAKYFTEDLGNGIALEMVEIPGGIFRMGSPEDERYRNEHESPQHQVTVPPFYMAKFPVNQAQWQAVVSLPPVKRELNPEPSLFKENRLPVEQVSWYDAVEFCQRLSQATGKNYRLPSEGEWEYACRAGTTTPFHFGKTITTQLANYPGIIQYANEPRGMYRFKTTKGGKFPPNAFGLYDMHGNVWEWCLDSWHDNYQGAPVDGSAWIDNSNRYRIIRGGSWFYHPLASRSAYRGKNSLDRIKVNPGFRCVVGKTL
ncbi:MAG: formylglycine-generating enzyme family protein [Waterburya sp.]